MENKASEAALDTVASLYNIVLQARLDGLTGAQVDKVSQVLASARVMIDRLNAGTLIVLDTEEAANDTE